MDLRASLNLPDPNFTIPMKADLPKAEPMIWEAWERAGLYERIQEARAGAEEFVLHDGPPYTNYPVHLGTALNKVLKDFVVKSRTMMGYRAPYIPGFDNHGLPIELAVLAKFSAAKKQATQAEVFAACREHAQEFIQLQTRQFKRLGVLGTWDDPYKTMAPRYEAELVRIFKRLVEKGYVYRGLRPTLWSPTSRTALADTEIVYKDHKSTAIYVRFPLIHDYNGFSKKLPNFYTIIWTTTPWTIPANLAVAFNAMAEYSIVRVGEDHYILGKELLDKVAEDLGWTKYEELFVELGTSVEFSKFKHPIFDRESLGVLADYVTMEEGTGVVHTAPGHGRDDFYTGQKYGLPILTPVDERGVLTADAGEFAGVPFKECDTVVVARLKEVGNLLDARVIEHSYPYAERDGKPVIFRATEQWFINLDHDNLRERMLKGIESVEWYPKSAKARITAMIKGRPDWCISRQRPWGVGLPVLYGAESGEPLLEPEIMDRIADAVEANGSGVWFEWPAEKFIPAGYKHPKTGETVFRKEGDTLDVWFDSGSTNLCVLEGNVNPAWKLRWPADVYLEGSDQHRGWFNTSLILATALHGRPPYNQVVTHGFVTDADGHKMSKRLGNAIDPEAACATYGADVVRYWVASVDYANDVPCSDAMLKGFGDHYRNIRNAFRFMLGNLYDYDPQAKYDLIPIDEWAMEQVDLLADECVQAYTRYDFSAVLSGIHNFCRNELSSFYLDVIKDRMYCDGATWPSRQSGQAACRYILERLVKLVAPILPFTAEETWQRLLGRLGEGELTDDEVKRSVHTALFDAPSAERLAQIEASPLQERFAAVLSARSEIFSSFETWPGRVNTTADPNLGEPNRVVLRLDSQDVVATYTHSGDQFKRLEEFTTEELANFFKLSWIELKEGEAGVAFAKSPYAKCERCRLCRPDVEDVNGTPLTARDKKVLIERGELEA